MTNLNVIEGNIIEGKEAYPYITEFKKEPFKSYLLMDPQDIGSFYFSHYDKIITLYEYYNENLFQISNLNLENVYWFLLLGKYLKEPLKSKNKKQIYEFIEKCEIRENDKLGFIFSPHSAKKIGDVWSTYFALASLKLIKRLKEYLSSKGENIVKMEIGNFITSHKKDNLFLHCLDKNCEICKKTSSARTIYFVLEVLMLLGVDVRTQRNSFFGSLKDRK
ncbi:MAG: hypothetical protein EU548_00405, partial [Promethearchaeota archaeon]